MENTREMHILHLTGIPKNLDDRSRLCDWLMRHTAYSADKCHAVSHGESHLPFLIRSVITENKTDPWAIELITEYNSFVILHSYPCTSEPMEGIFVTGCSETIHTAKERFKNPILSICRILQEQIPDVNRKDCFLQLHNIFESHLPVCIGFAHVPDEAKRKKLAEALAPLGITKLEWISIQG